MQFDPPADGGSVEVVGESHYQSTLQALAGGLDANGPRVRDHRAVLVPEPDNAYDPNAVRVIVVPPATGQGRWGKVGYLSRADAVAYRPVIDRLAALGYVVGFQASLEGGQLTETGQRKFVGVWLYLGTPRALMAELDRDMGANPQRPSQLATAQPDNRPYNRDDCPYCHAILDPLPKAKRKCPDCGQPVYVRAGPDGVRHLLREADLEALQAEWDQASAGRAG